MGAQVKFGTVADGLRDRSWLQTLVRVRVGAIAAGAQVADIISRRSLRGCLGCVRAGDADTSDACRERRASGPSRDDGTAPCQRKRKERDRNAERKKRGLDVGQPGNRAGGGLGGAAPHGGVPGKGTGLTGALGGRRRFALVVTITTPSATARLSTCRRRKSWRRPSASLQP